MHVLYYRNINISGALHFREVCLQIIYSSLHWPFISNYFNSGKLFSDEERILINFIPPIVFHIYFAKSKSVVVVKIQIYYTYSAK